MQQTRKEGRGTTPAGFAARCVLIALLVFLDQATKLWVVSNFAYGEFVAVTGFFNLCHVHNTGAAFSFLGDAGGWQIVFFAAVALAVTAGCLVALWRAGHRRLLSAALVLIAAGALGNMFDRAAFGFVVDFLDFHAFGWHWPAFNVADICVCCGAGLLVVEELFRK